LRRLADRAFAAALRVAAALPLLSLIGALMVLVHAALPSIRFSGVGFLTHSAWKVGNLYAAGFSYQGGVKHFPGADYGGLFLVVGTLASSAIAVVVGVPLAVGAAVFSARKLPPLLSQPIGVAIEVLASIPSVVIGLWGVLAFGPFMARHVYGRISHLFSHVPGAGFLTGPVGGGEGLLSSGLILALMIIPIVAATTRELLEQVPAGAREGAKALGMNEVECLFAVDFRYIAPGLAGVTFLGLGRALGETMAVAMVSGAALGSLPHNIYSTMTTIAATIVTQLDSAAVDVSGLATSALAEAAVILFLITVAVHAVSRALVRRASGTYLPIGRAL
jgi:phosphate transport system permease protein